MRPVHLIFLWAKEVLEVMVEPVVEVLAVVGLIIANRELMVKQEGSGGNGGEGGDGSGIIIFKAANIDHFNTQFLLNGNIGTDAVNAHRRRKWW
jgi:hypothetical protein